MVKRNGEAGRKARAKPDAGLDAEAGAPVAEGASHNEHVRRLEADLRATQERLQAAIEEFENTNEELRAVKGELAHSLLASTRIAALFLDNDLRLRSFTPATSEIFYVVESDIGRPISHITARVAYPELQEDARSVLKTLGQVEREVVNLEDDRQFLVRVLPHRGLDNLIAGIVVTFLDISRAIRSEAALRANEQRYGEALQLAGVGAWEWNLDTEEVWWSPVVNQLWGLPASDGPPRFNHRPVHRDDKPRYVAALDAARETGELNVEWRVRLADGSMRWLAATGRSQGRRMLGVTQDITERKQTETRLKLLLGELQHRVRNVLAVVRSVVSRTVRNATSVQDLAAHLNGRLETLARTQGVFTRTEDAAIDLEEMIRDELLSVAANEDHVTVDGPMVGLRREAAEMIALALHELTTNAVKYGALSGPNGRLAIRWRVMKTGQGPSLFLEWTESGVRALDTRPARAGFGRELLERGLPHELGASTSLEFAPGGLRALIELPLTERIAALHDLGRREA